jgi:hypothetical protein
MVHPARSRGPVQNRGLSVSFGPVVEEQEAAPLAAATLMRSIGPESHEVQPRSRGTGTGTARGWIESTAAFASPGEFPAALPGRKRGR